MIDRIRALPWWAFGLVGLALFLVLGLAGDGYVFRSIGAVLKTSLGLALGYYAHRHLIMQGERIRARDSSPAAQSQRLSRAILMAGCALAVALAV